MKTPLKIRQYQLEAKELRVPDQERKLKGYKVVATGRISSWTTHHEVSYFTALKLVHDLSMRYLQYTFDLEREEKT